MGTPDRAGARRRLLACALAAALLLGGCWDRIEIDDTSYVVSLGVDTVEQGYLWTFRFAEAEQLPVGMLATPTAAPRGLAATVITAHGGSLEQALQVVQAGTTRVVNLAQLRYIVFGADLARQGLSPVINQLYRLHQVRPTAGVSVSTGRAVDIFTNNRPTGDPNPAKFMEGILLVQKRVHLSPPIRLHHFGARLLAPGVDPVLPLVAVNPQAMQPPGSPLPALGAESLLAGDFPRAGGNPIEFAGTAVFRGDRLVGLLTVDETAALLALRGEMGKVYASVPHPDDPDRVITLRLHQENKPQYRARFDGDRPVVQVRLQFEGEVLTSGGNPGGWTEPADRRALERHIARFLGERLYQPLVRKVFREWGADPVGFGNLFRTRFATFEAWLDYRWPDRIRDLAVTVENVVFIRRFGAKLGDLVESEGG